MKTSCGLLYFLLQGNRKRRLCSCIWRDDIMQESGMISIWHLWQEFGGRRLCEFPFGAAWVMGSYLYVVHNLQSITDISDNHTFSVHSRQLFKLNRKVVISFAGINYVKCLANLHNLLRGLAIFRALCTSLENSTSKMGGIHRDYQLFWRKHSGIHCWHFMAWKSAVHMNRILLSSISRLWTHHEGSAEQVSFYKEGYAINLVHFPSYSRSHQYGSKGDSGSYIEARRYQRSLRRIQNSGALFDRSVDKQNLGAFWFFCRDLE